MAQNMLPDCNDSIIVKSIRVLAGGCPIFGEVDFASGPKNIIDNFFVLQSHRRQFIHYSIEANRREFNLV